MVSDYDRNVENTYVYYEKQYIVLVIILICGNLELI